MIASAIYWEFRVLNFYSNSFRFDIFIVQCLGVYFLLNHWITETHSLCLPNNCNYFCDSHS